MPTFRQKFKQNILPLAIIGALFFIFGLVSWVNAILIPYFKIACELTHTQAYLVALAFYIAYLVMAIPASKLLNYFGFKKGMMFGLWFMALGTLLFIPAALTRTYGIFLTGLFSIGTGLAILQTAANPYVTVIGPIESAARRISMMGLCNKFAGIISPLIFAALVLRASDSELFAQLNEGLMSDADRVAALDELIRRVIPPYAVLSVFLFAFGIFIRYSSLPEINTQEQNSTTDGASSHRTSIFQFPYLILGAVAIFFHVGSQVIAIDTIIGYAETMGLDLNEAKTFPSYTMICTLIGYLLGIVLIPKILPQRKALQICTITGMVLSLLVIFLSGGITLLGHQTDISIWFLVLLGMPNALIYAGIWPLAIRDLGRFTNLGSSLLVMGLCGNAFLPVIYGALADQVGVRFAYWVLIPCYIYLIFYAFYGYKVESWQTTASPQPSPKERGKRSNTMQMECAATSLSFGEGRGEAVVIYNGIILTPFQNLGEGSVVIEDGKIIGIESGRADVPGAEEIDAGGNYIAPGFIDLHTHGAGGSDFMDGTVEACLQIAHTHALHGTTLLYPTTVTATNEELFDFFDTYARAKEQNTNGAAFGGLHLEGPYFAYNHRGAQDPRYLRNPEPSEYLEILERCNEISRWSLAPELPGAHDFARELVKRGISPCIAHTDAIFEDVVEAYEAGFRHMTHFYSCMNGITRRKALRFAGCIEAGYLMDNITIEIIADGVHVPKPLLQLVCKIKGPENIALVTDSMRAAGMPEGRYILGSLQNGYEVIVEGGVAKLPDYSAFAGSVATADRLVRTMTHIADQPLTDAVRMMTSTPARLAGVGDRKGRIAPGYDADIVIFDQDIRVQHTLVGGKRITNSGN